MADDGRSDVLVLGGGPAGLAAALAFARAGRRVDVIEAAAQVGGFCRTMSWGDLRFDLGGHRFFTRHPEVDALVRGLAAGELIEVPRVSRICLGDRFLPMPPTVLGTMRAVPQVGLSTAIHAARTLIRPHRQPPPQTLEDYLLRRFGPALYRLIFEHYTAKVWGLPPARMSADWGAARIEGLSLLGVARRAVGLRGRGPRWAESFLYPRLGYGRIFERMAEAVQAAGGRTHTGARVTEVATDPGRFGVRVEDGREFTAPRLLSTLPVVELARMIKPELPAEALAAARGLRYRALLLLVLRLHGDEQVTPDTWLYFPGPDVPFCRLHEPCNWSRALAPPGTRSLVIEFFCDEGDDLWSSSDERIRHLGVAGLSTMGLLDPGRVADALVLRAGSAYPLYELGYHLHLRRVEAALSDRSGLVLAGRAGRFRYLASDESVEQGLEAARAMLRTWTRPGATL